MGKFKQLENAANKNNVNLHQILAEISIKIENINKTNKQHRKISLLWGLIKFEA